MPHSLAAHSPADQPTAAALAELLGELPLALEQARAYLTTTGRPPGEYQTALRAELAGRTGGLLRAGEPAHYQATVATTWARSLAQVRRTPGAQLLLYLLSLLAPETIPPRLLTDHAAVGPNTTAAGGRRPRPAG